MTSHMRVFKTAPPALTYEERHPYLVTLPKGEKMRFSNWPTAINTAVHRGKGLATVTYQGLVVQAARVHLDSKEFPIFAAIGTGNVVPKV